MKAIYVGSGPRNNKKGGIKWKLYMFLFVFLAITSTVLKIAAPTIVEKWLNRKGSDSRGFAFSIRDVSLSLSQGKLGLSDVKVFNPKTSAELLESPHLTIQVNLSDLLATREKKITVSADKVDVIISRDFASEIRRIKSEGNEKQDFYLDSIEGKFANLNIIEQKEDQSRTVLELKDTNVKIKDFGLESINKKTEFSVTSNIADGGKLNLTGKTTEQNGNTPWSIIGSLKKFPADLLNKLAGVKLPFSFLESTLNAEITARSENGKVSGEIAPEIRKLNVLDEKPGVPTRSIARILSEELTFKLPFTLMDELSVQYSATFEKLKNYRKFAGGAAGPAPFQAPASQTAKAKKSSFWPF